MITVSVCNGSASQEWDDYVNSAGGGTLFHKTGWRNAVERSFGHTPHYLMAQRQGVLCGVLPLFEVQSRLFGHSLVSVPFGVYGGIVASDVEAFAALQSHAEELARQKKVDYLELRTLPEEASPGAGAGAADCPDPAPAAPLENWHRKDLYVTFQRGILPTVEENLLAIPRKQRAMVRKGEKAGLTSRIGGEPDLESFYRIYATNVRDLGTPVFPLPFFRALMREFPDSFILSVWKDATMVAGVLTFVFKDALLPYYGGGLKEYNDLAINDFMYWELMRYGCENGYRTFDFGRSKKETGSYRFKKHWGFEPTELDYRFFLVRCKEMPNVSPLNPKYRLMINSWKRLPLPVANWLGPKLVGGIP